MNSRRKFILQGSLATTALLVAKPFSVIAKAATPFTKLSNSNSFVLLHTAHMHSCTDTETIKYITSLKETNGGVILATAGKKVTQEKVSLNYDVTPHNGEEQYQFNDDYKIIKKGNVKTGIIVADPQDANVIEKVKSLSTLLKNEKGCQVVVCLSQLGYKNKNGADDMTLAAATTDLDIIVGGHATNHQPHPMILQNKNKAEVIIHSASGFTSGCGKIEIEFDDAGHKKFVNLYNKTSDNANAA